MSIHRLDLTVHGRVQGVGFRYFVSREARALGLHGEVRNLAGGGVEVSAEGERENLQRLLAAVRRGPSGASVSRVEERWSGGTGRYRSFEIAR